MLNLPLFKRDIRIEEELDRPLLLHSFGSTIIKNFMDVLDYEVRYFNENQQESCKNIINKIISKYRPSLNIYQVGVEHREYLGELDEYINRLRREWGAVPSRMTLQAAYQLITSQLVSRIENIEHVNKESFDFNRELIAHSYQVQCEKGNVRIWSPNRKVYFSLIHAPHDYRHLDSIHTCHIIVFGPRPDSGSIQELRLKSKVSSVTIRAPNGNFQRIESAYLYSMFFQDLNEAIKQIEQDSILESRPVLTAAAYEICDNLICFDDDFHGGFDAHKSLNDAKALRNKLFNFQSSYGSFALHAPAANLFRLLKEIARFISKILDKIKAAMDFEGALRFTLAEIKNNNSLYIISNNTPKSSAIAYGEENLSAIMASNLRCLYASSNGVNIECESWVGNGRSDIKINVGNKTIAIIESKLIRDKSDIRQEVINGVDQLFARYSENITIAYGAHVGLYLVLFCHDKDFNAIDKKVRTAMNDYAMHENLLHVSIDRTENSIAYRLEDTRAESDFLSKKRVITIFVCNLEINYKVKRQQRTRISYNK